MSMYFNCFLSNGHTNILLVSFLNLKAVLGCLSLNKKKLLLYILYFVIYVYIIFLDKHWIQKINGFATVSGKDGPLKL
jgi:hypothetical protein